MGRAVQGAVTASLNAGGKMLEGKTLDAAEWQKDFQGARPLDPPPLQIPQSLQRLIPWFVVVECGGVAGSATQHAASVTPVGLL